MKTRRAHLAAALLTTAVALTGCASSEAGSVPDGWGTLRTKGVDVSYPKGYEEQGAGERGRHNAAAAVRTEGGRKVSVITVQLGFTEANSAEQAAIAAEAGIQMGADVKGHKDVELAGADEAKRIDFTFKATGEDGGPPKGTPVGGVILAGLDSTDSAFAVRIDAQRGSLPDGDLDRIIDSVEVH
ncbi:hypothetical protein PV963_29285 [Streptomyces coeruleorubidus]|uniref:hypothetical protein n=1 Tax=Streptomyces coeruleorubidus TaxID=116188 RepID=UPI00237F8113|nr:hypothetical protein [Streptomyces coeruleorubidus]WDV54162.1 hypothetical protein PV963_29285 [Streptomyces coeruleorubidus]